jgi:hypothetical protein
MGDEDEGDEGEDAAEDDNEDTDEEGGGRMNGYSKSLPAGPELDVGVQGGDAG